jgi:subtilisin family serine protease
VSTTRGPGVNIFAPGTDIMAATSRDFDIGSYTTTGYPGDATFPIMSIGGTSMASPQVAGVVAQHLQVFPNLTPAQMQTRIWNDSKAVMFTTGSDVDYRRIYDSLVGAPNRMLYSRYGRQALTTNVPGILPSISVS